MAGARQEGAAGFAKGLATGVAGAVALPLAGVAAGVVQLGRGVVNSVEAVEAKKAGKVRWLWRAAACSTTLHLTDHINRTLHT